MIMRSNRFQVGRHVRERTEGLLTCRFDVQGEAKDTVQKCWSDYFIYPVYICESILPSASTFYNEKRIPQYVSDFIYRVSQEECARLREGVPYVKIYRYNPKHLCPKLNGYGDNGQRSLKL
jgi:hypothetical protein